MVAAAARDFLMTIVDGFNIPGLADYDGFLTISDDLPDGLNSFKTHASEAETIAWLGGTDRMILVLAFKNPTIGLADEGKTGIVSVLWKEATPRFQPG